VTSSSPPAGAPTFAVVVWIRPDVHELPWPSAVMSRLPLPSRCTLLGEFVMVSISPVPKLEPGPVSYCQLPDGALPAAPLKSSLKTVDQPDGGPGTAGGAGPGRAGGGAVAPGAAGARTEAGARGGAGAAVAASAAEGAAIAVSATIQPAATASAASRRPRRPDQALTAWKALRASRSKPVIGHNLRRQEL